MGRIRRLALWFGGLGMGAFLLVLTAVLISSAQMRARHLEGRSLPDEVDVIVVLGAGIDPDGVISFPGRRRVAESVRLLAEDRARYLLFSGAGGRMGGGFIPLGDMMRDLAIQYGADPARLLAESRSLTTFQNLQFSLPLAEEKG
ncbi:MAG: YdcF family protein, partial [Pseudomonadota bacterium]